MVERQLLSDLSSVYAGYFASLSNQGRMAEAFRVIERARGRVEAQGLSHHETRGAAPADRRGTCELTKPQPQVARHRRSCHERWSDSRFEIYSAEQQLGTDSQDIDRPPNPVSLTSAADATLRPSELFIEYVLGEPRFLMPWL
jgi:hypothetical protein